MTFHVGQKVVCVDGRPGVIYREKTLVAGRVYRVDAISECGRGIITHDAPTPNRLGWWMHRFRPVIEHSTETGMAILRKIAEGGTVTVTTPAPQRTDA